MPNNYYTSTANVSWTAPKTAIYKVTCWGGGGGGGTYGRTTSAHGACGGGGGAWAYNGVVTAVKDTVYTIAVGVGGAGGAANNSNGTVGGDTHFNNNQIKGAGGLAGNRVSPAGAGGTTANSVGVSLSAGGAGAAYALMIGGGAGAAGSNAGTGPAASGVTGGTGNNGAGSGGNGGASNAAGNNGVIPGGGGGGAGGNLGTTVKVGGTGANGAILIEWNDWLLGVSNGGASCNGTIKGKGKLYGTANGIATVTGTIKGKVYYLSPTGDDITGTGTLSLPWLTLNKAWTVISAGDIIYMRGGTYIYAAQQYLTGKSGTVGNLIKIWAYSGEIPIITRGGSFSTTESNAGIFFTGNYVHFKGLTITGFYQDDAGVWPAMRGEDFNDCIFERIIFSESGMGSYFTSMVGDVSDNLFLNCDWYENYDPLASYMNADGCNLENISPGGTNTFRNCRFWNNSDDGLDLYNNESYVLVENCWAWGNGYREDRTTTGGNGNGFKLGGDTEGTGILRRLVNCLAFDNREWGYTENVSPCNMEFFHCVAYSNGATYGGGIHANVAGVAYYIKNCISFDNANIDTDFTVVTNMDHNDFDDGPLAEAADFISLSVTGVDGTRGGNGELPVLDFLKLVVGSGLRGAGVAVSGVTLDGAGNDYLNPPALGAYEYVTNVPVTAVTVTGEGSVTTITVDNGTLQMYVHIDPHDATDQTVVWSVIPGTGTASINQSGLLTAITNGTVIVKAVANG